MDRKGEQLAKDAFNSFLGRMGQTQTRWRRGHPRPDFYLRIASSSFAVEVTRAMLMIDVGGVKRTQHGWRAALEALSKRIEDNARTGGYLSGAYAMHLVPIPDFARVERVVVAAALDYIRRTQSTDVASSLVLARRPGGTPLRIEKIASAPSYVGGLSFVAQMKREHQIETELLAIVNERLERKRKRLSGVRLPRILLVVDSYLFGDSSHWRNVASLLDCTGYHSVVRVSGLHYCQVLKSDAAKWLSAV